MAEADQNGAVNIDFVIRERDMYKREFSAANDELLQTKAILDAVLKEKEKCSIEDIVRVRVEFNAKRMIALS